MLHCSLCYTAQCYNDHCIRLINVTLLIVTLLHCSLLHYYNNVTVLTVTLIWSEQIYKHQIPMVYKTHGHLHLSFATYNSNMITSLKLHKQINVIITSLLSSGHLTNIRNKVCFKVNTLTYIQRKHLTSSSNCVDNHTANSSTVTRYRNKMSTSISHTQWQNV